MMYDRTIPPDVSDAYFRMGVGEFGFSLEEKFEKHLKAQHEEAQRQKYYDCFQPERFNFWYGRPNFANYISRKSAANSIRNSDQRVR